MKLSTWGPCEDYTIFINRLTERVFFEISKDGYDGTIKMGSLRDYNKILSHEISRNWSTQLSLSDWFIQGSGPGLSRVAVFNLETPWNQFDHWITSKKVGRSSLSDFWFGWIPMLYDVIVVLIVWFDLLKVWNYCPNFLEVRRFFPPLPYH